MTHAGRLQAAIELLAGIEAAQARPADAVANDFFRARRFIGGGDRRAISELAWAALRAPRRLAWWLRDADATPRLLIAAHLLLTGHAISDLERLFSGARFAPAALNRAELAALRRIAGHTIDHPDMPDPVRWDIPDFLLPHLRARFGDDLAREMAAIATPAPLDLRVNLLKATHEDAIASLRAENLNPAPTPFSPWGLRLPPRQSITNGLTFRNGLVEIQDEGSQLIALLVDARPGMRVADYCAGAAGKTLAMAMTMSNKGHIAACDVSATRLDAAVRRLRRAGVHNVERHLIEPGQKWSKRAAASFDRVLVDAPCTGTGTWRRNPDAKSRTTRLDLADLLLKQAQILDAAMPLVREGGHLVYATCSLLAEENEDQVRGFLTRHPAFRQRPLPPGWPTGAGDALRLSPAQHGTDGFFAAVLERAA